MNLIVILSLVFCKLLFYHNQQKMFEWKKKITANMLVRDPVTLREEDLGKPCIWLAFIQTASRCFSKGTLVA